MRSALSRSERAVVLAAALAAVGGESHTNQRRARGRRDPGACGRGPFWAVRTIPEISPGKV